ncbi:MAG: papain-like cysteine protease family protein, partial [Oscillospiraceae bacterium]
HSKYIVKIMKKGGFFMKKAFTIILTSVMLISCFSFSSFANQTAMPYTSSECERIITAIESVEHIKDQMGLSSIDFSTVTISNTIKTYDYTEDGVVFNSDFIPIKSNNSLIAWAIKFADNQDTFYQISTAYIDEINALIDENTTFSLIYDYNACFLYQGNNIVKLGDVTLKDESRSIINSIDEIPNLSDIQLNDFSNSYVIANNSSAQQTQNNMRTPVYYGCSVGYVSQFPPSQSLICWAASVASIVNYKKNTSHTAIHVAQTYKGPNYNVGLTLGYEVNVLRRFGLNGYTHNATAPADGVILNNMMNDYPIYGSFKHSGNKYHAVVIHGIDIINGYISIMDPEYGFCSASITSSGYRFVSGYSGVLLTLDNASCKYWTV